MNGTESTAVTRLRSEWLRRGLISSLMGMVLFVAIGAVGLLGEVSRGPGAERTASPERAALGASGEGGHHAVALAWDTGSSEVRAPSPPDAESWTPWVLVSEGLAEFEASESEERGLLLEPDGTLRRESSGTLVGFLQGGVLPEQGDLLSGPGPIALKLLHQDAWLAESARVPILEEDGAGGWIVTEHRAFEIVVEREPLKPYQIGPGRPRLHPRTGLPQVELIAQRD